MRKLPNLNSILYFEAVARHSRINTAAAELMVSPSAVSQRIRAIETEIGVRLFRRIKRRLVLTEEGERFYAAAARSLAILRDAQHDVSRARKTRTLAIRVSASFGVRWLSPRLCDFISRHPEWEVHVDATPELTDFEKEKVDLEIRYDPEPPTGLHARLLLTDRVLPMCAPSLLEEHHGKTLAETLASTRLIHTVKARVPWRWWLENNGVTGVNPDAGLKFDRSSMALQSAVDGLGVVLETATLAFDELESGRLAPLAPQCGTTDLPAYHLICPSRHLNRRAVRSFTEWVETQVASYVEDVDALLASHVHDARAPYPYAARHDQSR